MSSLTEFALRHVSKIPDVDNAASSEKAIVEIIAIVLEFIKMLQECRNKPPASTREEAVTAKRNARKSYHRGFYSLQIVRKMRIAAMARNAELSENEAEEISLDALDNARLLPTDELERAMEEAKTV